MSTDRRLQARVVRRELHSPRSALAIGVAVLAVVALAWVGTESVLAALSRPALLLDPAAIAAGVRGLPTLSPAVLAIAGGIVALIGLVLVVVAVTPGRRGRHVIRAGGTAVVVDDEVVASALVRAASATAGVSPDRAVASVGRRSGVVRITPVSGVPVDVAAVQRAATEAADGFGLVPPIRVRAVLDRRGKVGA